MKKREIRKSRITVILIGMVLVLMNCQPVYAAGVPREDTPDYKVAFYAFDCYHMQDANGKRYGYGYEMMQGISKYLQCTFSYVGYEKSAAECFEMLRNGEIDIYTAAKRTPQREADFVFSTHPAITARTCMNVKRGNTKVVAGDYATYNGLKIGLLERHTYNERFIEFTKEKGFDCEIVYYAQPTELSNALISGEVDALVNSYIRTPEDEVTIENFGETPYYFVAKKEDRALIEALDKAVDEMNIETPNWRSDLYNRYYGSQDSNTKLTEEERALLQQMQEDHTIIRAVMRPENNPYSWYDDGEGYGIVADLFTATVQQLGLDYEIVPVASVEEYENVLSSGAVDIWLDMDSYYEDQGTYKYKMTDTYLSTTVSVLHRRGSAGKISRIGVMEDTIAIREMVQTIWPNARMVLLTSTQQCVQAIFNDTVDAVLMMSYRAQKIAREDVQNRLTVDIVPGASLDLKMGVNANDSRDFYGIWEKTLAEVASNDGDRVVQNYLEKTTAPSLLGYLYDHPTYFIIIIVSVGVTLLVGCLYIQSVKAKNRQMRISRQLSDALAEARQANEAKLNFFSKMSHDIRTPLNAVLGMTQIAQKCEKDQAKLDNALEVISTEGNYLLTMINSILDVNQLEYGHIELVHRPFYVTECMTESVNILRPLATKKEQKLCVTSDCEDHIVVGDFGRFSQIMVNIVSNAVKYTNVGGQITVSLEALPGHVYRFTCTDNGIGMKQEYIQHICEEYSRAEDSRTSVTEGTGLGMAVVKGFTDLMKGTLSVKSRLGEGSTFIVEIPFDEPTEKELQFVQKRASEQNLSRPDFKGKKVLLVEDNALNAEIARELLTGMGLEVDWAENGQRGVEIFEQSAPNTYFAIFMDMQMPVMDGITATRKIRNLDREDKQVTIFAMTANTLEKDRRDCREAGMNGYISKPVSMKEIESVLREKMTET